MKKTDPVVKKETMYVVLWTLILSALLHCVFFIIGKWNWTVSTGNLLGAAAAVLNFYLMCLGVLAAVKKEDEKDAKAMIRMSQSLRTFMLLAFAAAGAVFTCFNTWTVLISLFFPRIAILFRPQFDKKQDKKHENEAGENADE